MFRSLTVVFILATLTQVGLTPSNGYAQFGGLLARVPPRANAIVIVNIEKILASPIAEKENWRSDRTKAHERGLTFVPLNATQFVMAAQMDFEFMQPTWEVALMNLDEDVSTVKIAAEKNGQIDRINDRNAVVLPIDAYLVQLAKATVGVMRPANRQVVARWLRQTDAVNGQSNLSPYLAESANFAVKAGTPVIMAIDLQDVISPEIVRARAAQMDSLKGQNLNLEQLAEAVASIRGVALGITVGERIVGAIKVDFEKDVSALGDLAKPLLLEALGKNGVMIDEFNDWELQVEENRISLGGTLEQSALLRLSSLFASPPVVGSSPATASAQTTDSDSLQKLASQQYFKSVQGLIDDLREKPDTTGVKTLGQVGAWFGKYARRIDELPILNVDPELLDYGAYVASALRQAESTFRGSGGRARVASLNVPTQYDVVGGYRAGYGRWGAYGGYGGYAYHEDVRAMQEARTEIRTEERVNTAASGRDIMQQISEATAEVRRKMTQKYQVEF